jgi:hypothetical protein
VPQRGEVIVHPDGVEFEVVEADPRRIRRLRIRPAPDRAMAGDLGPLTAIGNGPLAEPVNVPLTLPNSETP